MQSDAHVKTTSVFSTLVGMVLVGVLSACGGGGSSDGTKRDGSIITNPSENPLNKYIGTYSDNNRCWDSYLPTLGRADKKFQLVLSASNKPNTLNFSDITFFYEYTPGAECTVEVGSSTAFGEITYYGTLPSVEFFNSTKQALSADKVYASFINVINEGLVGTAFDELSDYENSKSIIALEGNTMYSGDRDAPVDAEGFPTKFEDDSSTVRQ